MSDLPIDVDAEAIFLDGSWYTREDLSRRIKAMLDSGDFNVARPSAALERLTQTLSTVRTLVFRCTPELADGLNQLAARTGQSVGGVIRDAVTKYLSQQGVATGVPPGGGVPGKGPVAPTAPSAIPAGVHAAPAAPAVSTTAAPSYPVPAKEAPAPQAAPSASFNSLPVVIDVDDEEPRQQEPTVRRAIPAPPTGTTQDDLPKVIVEEQPMVIAGPGALANAGITRPLELTQKKPAEHKPDESVSSEHRWFKQ